MEDTAYFLTCPSCGKKYDIISRTNGKWLCWKCRHELTPEGQDIPREMWKAEPVKSVRCDRCNDLVQITPGNVGSQTGPDGRRFMVLFCPRSECRDRLKDKPNWLLSHALAVKYAGRWYKPQAMLFPDLRDSLK